MNKILGAGLLGVVATVLSASPLGLAKGSGVTRGQTGEAGHAGGRHSSGVSSQGFSQGEKKGWSGEKTPPGWGKGKKPGWQGAPTPPGLAKTQSVSESQAADKS